LNHASDNDFVLELRPKDRGDRIVLAKIPRLATLAAAIESVKARIDAGAEDRNKITAREVLTIPLVVVDALRKYTELEGRQVVAPHTAAGWWLETAEQGIQFRLDEFGADLKSSAALYYYTSAPRYPPRRFVFDGPFLLWLQRDGAEEPYFAIWVETPELLVKADR
jgi:hypothetical protein